MNDAEYMSFAEAALSSIESSCDRINDSCDIDLDNQRVGGMITISFPNGSQLIVNLQKPLQEIWLAAKSGGYHYRHSAGAWLDTKTGEELFSNLSREASVQAGLRMEFSLAT